jgi:hypothetical protein
MHLQKTFITKYIGTNLHLNSTATASYDYASTQKSVTFTKDSITQTIEVPIYDDSCKEGDEKYQTLIINSFENFKKQDIIISIFKKVA